MQHTPFVAQLQLQHSQVLLHNLSNKLEQVLCCLCTLLHAHPLLTLVTVVPRCTSGQSCLSHVPCTRYLQCNVLHWAKSSRTLYVQSQADTVMKQRYCMPISLAYWTHCAPPQKVLPKRMRKIKTDLSAPLLTNVSCMNKKAVTELYSVKALPTYQVPSATSYPGPGVMIL